MCAHGRTLADPRLSPKGDRAALVVSSAGRAQVVVLHRSALGWGPETVVTSDPAPQGARTFGGGVLDWTPDGEALVFAGKDGALWWVAATGGPARLVTPAPAEGAAQAPAVSPDGAWVAFVADERHVLVTALRPEAPSWPQPLSAGADFCFDPCWSPDGRTVAWHEWDVPAMPWDSSRIVARGASEAGRPGSPVVVAGGEGVAVQQPRFGPDGRLGFLCDAGGWLNLWVATDHGAAGWSSEALRSERHEHGSPAWGMGQRSFAWAPEGDAMAFARNEEGFGRLCRLDLQSGEVEDLGKGVHGSLTWVGDQLACLRSGARTPTVLVAYEGGQRTTIARGPVAGFESAGLVEPEVVTWPGEDGGEVHGRLYRTAVEPATGAGNPPPLIGWIHGGPTDQWQVTFIPRLAYLVERGWSVLLVDHRGSTGWGRAYTQAMAGRWGDLDVADTAAGLRHAAAQGWCDPARMVVMGGSAGGFTVLNLLARHPDLCAAGVDLYGVADLFDLDETTHRFEAHYLQSLVGPLPEAATKYRERSPVHHAEGIVAPLLILQGEDDPVVPPAQSRAIADRLVGLGRRVETHFYPGEGHGWGKPETVIDELGRVESFLRRHVLRWRSS